MLSLETWQSYGRGLIVIAIDSYNILYQNFEIQMPFPSPQFWAFSQGIRTVLKASLALQSLKTSLLAWYMESHKWKSPAVHNDAFGIEWF